MQPYLETASKQSSRIRYIIDSHSHADHVSGARRLAKLTGGELVLPELADVAYEATRAKGGDKITMGEVVMEFIHTPGHRPEQLCLLIYDTSRGDAPWAFLTADFLLVPGPTWPRAAWKVLKCCLIKPCPS